MNDQISYNGNVYFVNGGKPTDPEYKRFFGNSRRVETSEAEYYLATRKHFAFNPRHLHNGYDDLAWVKGFFSDIHQPGEDRVRNAMILQITDNCGDGSCNRYSLKAGGGSQSDSIFSSSLSILIANPSTGNDQWVVLMKKYSTVFSDVLICFDEILALFDLCSNEQQKRERDLTYTKDIIGLLIQAMANGYVNTTKSTKLPYSDQEASRILSKCLARIPFSAAGAWQQAFQYFERRIKESQQYVFEERCGERVNERHQVDCLQRLARVKKLHSIFSSLPACGGKDENEAIRVPLTQGCLFV